MSRAGQGTCGLFDECFKRGPGRLNVLLSQRVTISLQEVPLSFKKLQPILGATGSPDYDLSLKTRSRSHS